MYCTIMEPATDIVRSRKLIKVLSEKFDKLEWKYEHVDYYILEIADCTVKIGKQQLFIYNKNTMILINIPTSEELDAFNHAMLWGKIDKKYRRSTDIALSALLEELNKLG